MNSVKSVYHVTRQNIYLDNGDGSLELVKKTKHSSCRTVAYFKNTPEGHNCYRNFRKMMTNWFTANNSNQRIYKMFRCPKDGKSYDFTNNGNNRVWSRRGSVKKRDSLVFSVLVTNP